MMLRFFTFVRHPKFWMMEVYWNINQMFTQLFICKIGHLMSECAVFIYTTFENLSWYNQKHEFVVKYVLICIFILSIFRLLAAITINKLTHTILNIPILNIHPQFWKQIKVLRWLLKVESYLLRGMLLPNLLTLEQGDNHHQLVFQQPPSASRPTTSSASVTTTPISFTFSVHRLLYLQRFPQL